MNPLSFTCLSILSNDLRLLSRRQIFFFFCFYRKICHHLHAATLPASSLLAHAPSFRLATVDKRLRS